MKQKDVALIIIVIAISAVVSWVITGKLFVTASDRQQKVYVVQSIDANFPTPNNTYFNSSSVDPTQLIQIGNNNNANPFSGSSQ